MEAIIDTGCNDNSDLIKLAPEIKITHIEYCYRNVFPQSYPFRCKANFTATKATSITFTTSNAYTIAFYFIATVIGTGY